MGHRVKLTADDGHVFDAYVAGAGTGARAGVVILQEIFGVNAHIRSVADRVAAEGYLAVAPALFDRVRSDVQLDYGPDGIAEGRTLATAIGAEQILGDTAAALAFARGQTSGGLAGVVGFCLGGSYAWLAATRLKVDAAVGYYGSLVAKNAAEVPRAPVLLHFGDADKGIPLSDVEAIRAAHPELPVYVYAAGHGFNCDARASYNAEAAALAWQRTREFLGRALLP